MESVNTILQHFESLTDPRIDRTKLHLLSDIVAISLCAVVGGSETWEDIAQFGESHQAFFEEFLELPEGIPSQWTFFRVLAALDPEEFSDCFLSWMSSLAEDTDGEIVAMDGKTLRRSFDRQHNKFALQMVSAWATENELVLGQVAVEEGSNEKTAIPKLIQALDLQGTVVTIDAAGTDPKNAELLTEQGADFTLALKKNQPRTYQQVDQEFRQLMEAGTLPEQADVYETSETGHGREEYRWYYSLPLPEDFDCGVDWPGLQSLGMVVSQRIVKGKEQWESRYYLSSLEADAQRLGEAVRRHWEIENKLHWILDVGLREDECRKRKDNSGTNFAMLRRLAVSLLKRAPHKNARRSIKGKQKQAGWDTSYLVQVLIGD